MDVEVRFGCSDIDWNAISETLKTVGMGYCSQTSTGEHSRPATQPPFLFHEGRMVGFGRAISDGVYQAAIYDCAVLPEYQGHGLGAKIVTSLLDRISHCNVILYAKPDSEGFYEKHGFRRMKTGMARFQKDASMRDRGFT
jgi:ribosomal protein S18 acetylase RimI-like enzyme